MCYESVSEIWKQLTEIYNLPFTITFGLLCLYWLISVLGVFDFGTDVDLDIDADMDADISGLGGAMKGILSFVNAADVPIMLILTFISGIGLILNITMNSAFNPNGNIWIAICIMLIGLLVSAVITRYVTRPLKPLFQLLKKDEERKVPIIGRVGIVKSGSLDQEFGQVEVAHESNSPSLLNCVLSERNKPMKKGEKVLIIAQDEISQKYVVCSLHSAGTEQLVSSPDFTPQLEEEIQQQNIKQQYEQ